MLRKDTRLKQLGYGDFLRGVWRRKIVTSVVYGGREIRYFRGVGRRKFVTSVVWDGGDFGCFGVRGVGRR